MQEEGMLVSIVENDTYKFTITSHGLQYNGELSIERKDGNPLTADDIPALKEIGEHVSETLYKRNRSVIPGIITEAKLPNGSCIKAADYSENDLAKLIGTTVEDMTKKCVAVEIGKGADDQSRFEGTDKKWAEQIAAVNNAGLKQITARIYGNEMPTQEMAVVKEIILGYMGKNPNLMNLRSTTEAVR